MLDKAEALLMQRAHLLHAIACQSRVRRDRDLIPRFTAPASTLAILLDIPCALASMRATGFPLRSFPLGAVTRSKPLAMVASRLRRFRS